MSGFVSGKRVSVGSILMMVVACLAFATTAAPAAAQSGAGQAVALASDGNARWPIVIKADASDPVREHAKTLAAYLQKITGASFTIEQGDGLRGIALGVAGDFKIADLPEALQKYEPDDALGREKYLIRSHAQGVVLMGATELGLQHAVWDMLRTLGYRQFFPGETWEVIPSLPEATIKVDRFEAPDFHTRWIWYGFGLSDFNRQAYADWCVRNRAIAGFKLTTSHCYQRIIAWFKEDFQAHPEYLALVDGQRQGHKFCIANPGLRKLVREKYVSAYFEKYPDADCISMEPSDGLGWCECDDCAKLGSGSVTDRVVMLANEVAKVVAEKYPGKYVGLLAYSQHSPPPTVKVHERIIVKVQTAFLYGGLTFDEIIQGWQKQGARVGVGDYYSIFQGDNSRPARQKGSDLARIAQNIPHYHEMGARFFMAESSDLWGALGLGHYLAAQLIWDVDQAKATEAIYADFFEKAFGPAKQPMEAFYRLIYRFEDDSRRPLIRRDMLARMYRHLDEAMKLAQAHNRPDVMARLNDLALFTRVEELFQQMEDAPAKDKQASLEALLAHVWKTRDSMMVHAKVFRNPRAIRWLRPGGGVEKVPDTFTWPTEAYTADQIARFVREGVASTEPVELGFEIVDFSDDLMPAAALKLPDTPREKWGDYNRIAPSRSQTFFTWVNQPGEIALTISGGHIVHYRNIAGPVQTTLYSPNNPIVDEPVAQDQSVPPDGSEKRVVLQTSFTGMHQVDVWPPANRAKVEPAVEGTPWVMAAKLDEGNHLSSVWSMYFYVPKGTKVVGGFASRNRGHIIDGDGNVVLDLGKGFEAPGFFKAAVPQGQDGKLWQLRSVSGKMALLTVPPYLTRSAQELMLPREVVEADSQTGASR